MRTDVRTDTTKPSVGFRNFEKAPKINLDTRVQVSSLASLCCDVNSGYGFV
jgi:hypothetical protein